MSFRILHAADLHIGANQALFGTKYLARQSDMMDQLIEHARINKVKAVVIPGDIFDSANVTNEERAMFLRKLLVLDTFTHTLVIPGNHDEVSPGLTTLHHYAMMTKAGHFKRTTVVERTSLVLVEDALFLLVVAKYDYAKHVRAALKSLRKSSLQVPYKHLVVVAHQTVKGSIADNGHALPDGVDWDSSLQEAVPITYYALGDIHGYQRVGKRAWYSGSPLHTKFDPKKQDHGCLLVDLDDPDHPKHLPVVSKKLLVLKGSDMKAIREAEKSGHLVKVKHSKNATADEIAEAATSKAVVRTAYGKVDLDLGDLKVGGNLRPDVKAALKRRSVARSDRPAILDMLDEFRPSSLDANE